MRKMILTALLMASAAMPAMAQDRGGFGRHHHDDGNATVEPSEQRPARAERVAPADRAERERPQAGEQGGWSPRAEGRQRVMQQQQAQEPAFQQPAMRQQGERRAWAQRRQERGDAIQPQGFTPPAPQNEVAPMQRYGRTREGYGTRDGFGARDATGQNRSSWTQTDRSGSRYARTGGQWSNQWRTNRDYDWRRHRDSHRSLYRLGHYRDPYGSRYRRFSIGFSLFPSYYQSNYWLDDPYMYRLPQAYGPYRWVRYYGDALLVNIYTGQVVDVVYDFFW